MNLATFAARMRRAIYTFIFGAVCVINLEAQVNTEKYGLRVNSTSETITLDGELNEETWLKADKAANFITTFPNDSSNASSQTEVMLSYDDNFLYIAGICYVGSDKEHVLQSLRRDFSWPRNDNLSIYFDPFNDYTNGFTFGITPAGIEREGLVTNGQRVSSDWDNKWFSKVKDFGDRWQFEMKIPFKTIRYNSDAEHWNIIFLRKDLKNNEESTWVPVPQGYRPSSFAFAGKLEFDKKLKKAGPNFAVIPFVAGGTTRDFEDSENDDNNFEAGFDAKIGVSSSLNLDLTYNPDFSQVEVDRQVTNLDRFEIFFPERRQFFLENQDLFSEGGFFGSRPFFSRRIGIAQDTAGGAVQLPIQYGARLSGKIGKDWRVGLLNMQTEGRNGARLSGTDDIEDTYKLLPQNYTVGILQRQIFGRSNVGVTVVNRQALDYSGNEEISSTTEYNRVAGIDYNLLSQDGRWEGDIFAYKSFDEDQPDDAFAAGAFMGYNSRTLRLRARVELVGDGYNAEVGFVRRKNIVSLGTFNDYFFYPKNSKVIRHGPGMGYNFLANTEMERTDLDYNVSYNVVFTNTSEFEVRTNYNYVKLRNSFDPTSQLPDSLESSELQAGEDFDWRSFEISYESDRRRLFSYEASYRDGGFFNGHRRRIRTQFSYRFQPYGQISMTVDYNDLYDFPEPFADLDFWLVGPRLDVTFTNKLFLTTFVQYNEQADNVNLNARLQWRFKPVSDLFVVYSDNYLPSDLGVKNRSIILKLTYWLNF